MCTVVAGDQPLNFLWLKDGETLQDRGKTHKLDDYTVILSLRRLQLEDMGNYTCQVSNPAGVAAFTATLKVKGTFILFRTPNFLPFMFRKEKFLRHP